MVYFFPPTDLTDINKGYKTFGEKWNSILDVFEEVGVKFALEVHPTEIAYDIYSAERTLKEIINSDPYRKRAQDMFDLKCPGCTCGYVYNFMITELPSTVKYVLGKFQGLKKYL